MSESADVLKGDFLGDWWGRVLFGLMLVLWGFIAWMLPGLSLLTAILLFGVLCLFGGIALIAFSLAGPNWAKDRKWVLVEGIVLFVIGLMAMFLPGVTAVTLLYLFAAMLIVNGLFEIAFGMTMPESVRTETGKWSRLLMIVGGFFAVLVGLLMFIFPGEGLLAILYLAGAVAVIVGAMMIAQGISASRA